MKIAFHPKLLDCLPTYNRAQFGKDLASGITVGVLALPLAMAFAIASGCSPSAGIWTAIVAGLITSLFGGSRVQIGGPTGAFIPIIYGIVAIQGFANLMAATMLAGIFLLAMGLARLGQLIRFIPITVVIGFTNGIAVVIFLAQIKDFFGLKIDNLPAEFFLRIKVLAANAHSVDLPTLALATACFIFLLSYNWLAQRFALLRRAPGPLAVLLVGTLVSFLFDLPVETIGSRFGGIPQELPHFGLPDLSIHDIGKLISPAITIALLGAIESLLSARVADSMIDDRHDPNQELVAQGLANIAAPLFGGFAATGAIARTSTNVKSGGRTPIAGVIHALVLLGIVLLAAPLASYVPLATLSAIVMVVAINMGEWHEFKELRRYSYNYRVILLATFFVTVVFDLTIAVELGMVLASLFFIYRMSELTRVERRPLREEASEPQFLYPDGTMRVAAWQLFGSLFFGAVNKLEVLLDPAAGHPEVVILDMTQLIQLDTTGLEGLESLLDKLHKRGCRLLVCGLNSQPGSLLYRSGFIDHLGDENVCLDLTSALARAYILLPNLMGGSEEDY
ncbi:SulP family inorganic anion transporter [Dechloromonas denitrificans]|uniref:SulP family inorganic anion transporter n=1 Tax=Dechloromonas denitrificans TaxID=281362 RepID=UPI001CF88999|nr:SulP family inorganic anion transporter [Dechloromonas denitrificans]UCV03013.1 STAS domain-containing protein [Dechloromonas denitrificans]UCV07330.1 STAS domain-containing protein [Dechloromonas denitrificans]